MNEWKQLLEQTHPQFKSVMTVEEALEQANQKLVEEVDSAMDHESDRSLSEIEWISPTHKLQSKIENIPDKFGFKIGEAADYVGVKQYVLRYWESEFDILRPKKSKNGQRVYTKKDVETALLIKKLLHEDRFSIEGAQSALRKLRKQVKDKVQEPDKVLELSKEKGVEDHFHALDFAENLLESIRKARLQLNL